MASNNNGKGFTENAAVFQEGSLLSNYGQRSVKTGSIICLTLFVGAAFLSLAQMWFQPLAWDLFFMIIITLSVLFVVALGITLVRNQYMNNAKLKDAGYID